MFFVRPRSKTLSKARKEKLLEAAGRVLSGVAGKEAEARAIDVDDDAKMPDASEKEQEDSDSGSDSDSG